MPPERYTMTDDLNMDIMRAISDLKMGLFEIDRQMRSDSKTDGLVDIQKIRDLSDSLIVNSMHRNQWVAESRKQTIDSFNDQDAIKYFNLDRGYLEYLKGQS